MKSATCRMFLLLWLLVDFAWSEIYISQQSLVKQEYDSFSVTCKDDNGAGLSWKGPKNRPLGERTNPQAKATMHGIHLIFKNIKKDDAGIYTCKTSTDSAKFELFVTKDTTQIPDSSETSRFETDYTNQNKKPNTYPTYRITTAAPYTTKAPLIFVDTDPVVTGREGTNILLRCEAKDANTEWLVNGEPPTDDVKYKVLADALLIKNANIEDSKNNYSCIAINTDVGQMANKPISLIVTHPPRPKYMRENIVYGYIGGVVNLTCEVDAEPPPTFNWFQKGEKYKIYGKQVNGTIPTVSVLMLALRNSKDLGDYKCEARNSEGTVEVIFTVLNSSQPNPPEFLEVKDANSSALLLTIEEPELSDFENNTGLSPTGFLVEYKPLDEPQWSSQNFLLADDKMYTLTNLTKNTTYQVRAATINPAGLSEFTNITEYATSSAYIISTNLPHLFTMFNVLLILSDISLRHI